MSKGKRKVIAVLRGGNKDHTRSLKNGTNVILSLERYKDEIDVIDVILDKDNNWFEKGVPSDPHKVFSKADFYLDLTDNKEEKYHDLAKRLQVLALFEDLHVSSISNRITTKRILNQLNVSVPKYILIRDKQSLRIGLQEAWSRLLTPIVIKESNHEFNEKSLVTYSFLEAYNKAKEILDKGGEVLVEEHIAGKYISVAALPDYRGESLYIPTPAEVYHTEAIAKALTEKLVQDKYLPDHTCDKRCMLHLEDSLRKEIQNLTENIYKTFALSKHALIDFAVSEKKGKDNKKEHFITVLDIHSSPSIFEDSRFDFILKSTGVDIGKFILDKIEKLEEERDIY